MDMEMEMTTMTGLEVHIVQLPALRVASVYGFGASPELLAWEKLLTWATDKGLLDEPPTYRIFGFNNPNPTVGSPNYGYEFWISVGPQIESDDVAIVKEFPGGRYAVTRCVGVEEISGGWQALVAWLVDSGHGQADHQWLEEHIGAVGQSPQRWTIALHAPIAG